MFGIGMPEMILILAVALIVIGPKKLPDLAKSLGKAMGEFKKATSDLKESMQIDTELKDLKTTFDDLERDDIKSSKTAVGDADKKSVDNDGPVKTSNEELEHNKVEDPMDPLKAAFNGNNNVVDPAGDDGSSGISETDSARCVDPESEAHKDVG